MTGLEMILQVASDSCKHLGLSVLKVFGKVGIELGNPTHT